MNRYFVEIAYNGTHYHGWQIQPNANSVQAEINKALSTILQSTIKVQGAGRTDAGVHAKQLFIHFDTNTKINTKNLRFKLNNFLPKDISCQTIFKVKSNAHSRFDAISRTYEYLITLNKNPFLIDQAYHFSHPLDLDVMNKAAAEIIKYTDFSSFSKKKTDTFTNNCKVTEAHWQKKNNQILFTITADRFLRNMVRAIVGTLIDVGQHKITIDQIHDIINAKNRNNAGVSAPAHGLSLTKITYPKEILDD